MCPELTIPTDTSGWATGRRIHRQFDQGEPVTVGVIPDNSTTVWIDGAPQFNFDPPPTLGTPDGEAWMARSNYPNSEVWVPGNQVFYATMFVFAGGGESPLSPWSPPIGVDYWAMPYFTDLPLWVDPQVSGFPQCVGRRLYRRCKTSLSSVVQDTILVAEVSDNVATSVRDSTP